MYDMISATEETASTMQIMGDMRRKKLIVELYSLMRPAGCNIEFKARGIRAQKALCQASHDAESSGSVMAMRWSITSNKLALTALSPSSINYGTYDTDSSPHWGAIFSNDPQSHNSFRRFRGPTEIRI